VSLRCPSRCPSTFGAGFPNANTVAAPAESSLAVPKLRKSILESKQSISTSKPDHCSLFREVRCRNPNAMYNRTAETPVQTSNAIKIDVASRVKSRTETLLVAGHDSFFIMSTRNIPFGLQDMTRCTANFLGSRTRGLLESAQEILL
jgi:hypothetical protein